MPGVRRLLPAALLRRTSRWGAGCGLSGDLDEDGEAVGTTTLLRRRGCPWCPMALFAGQQTSVSTTWTTGQLASQGSARTRRVPAFISLHHPHTNPPNEISLSCLAARVCTGRSWSQPPPERCSLSLHFASSAINPLLSSSGVGFDHRGLRHSHRLCVRRCRPILPPWTTVVWRFVDRRSGRAMGVDRHPWRTIGASLGQSRSSPQSSPLTATRILRAGLASRAGRKTCSTKK
jgi:hypothetical protein